MQDDMPCADVVLLVFHEPQDKRQEKSGSESCFRSEVKPPGCHKGYTDGLTQCHIKLSQPCDPDVATSCSNKRGSASGSAQIASLLKARLKRLDLLATAVSRRHACPFQASCRQMRPPGWPISPNLQDSWIYYDKCSLSPKCKWLNAYVCVFSTGLVAALRCCTTKNTPYRIAARTVT